MKVKFVERSTPTYIMVDAKGGVEIADVMWKTYDKFYTSFLGWQEFIENAREAPESRT